MKKGLANIVDTFSGKHWLELKLDSLGSINSSHREVKINEFHPHLAGSCPRYIQYIMNEIIVDGATNHRVQRIFDNGSDAHVRYQRYFQDLGILKEAEKRMRVKVDDIVLVGSCDAIVEDCDKKDFLVELKTINSKGFNALTTYKFEHFLQWNLYSGGLKITQGAILYEDKDTQNIKIFPAIFDYAHYLGIIDVFKDIYKYTCAGKLIPVESCKNRWCSAKKMCKENLFK